MNRSLSHLALGSLLLLTALPQVSAQTFEDWQAVHFSPAELADETVSGAAANPVRDGLNNLLKYAFDLDPHAPAIEGAPAAQFFGGVLALNFFHRDSASDLYYALEASPDLTHWSLRNSFAPSATLPPEEEVTQWTVADPYPWAAGASQFLRLRVVRGAAWLSLTDPPDRVSARTVSAPFGLELRWSDHSNVELGYRVERQRVVDNVWDLFAITGQDTIAYFDRTVQSGAAYNYRVRAIFADGQFSSWSESGSFTPMPPSGGGPDGPGSPGGGPPDPDPDTDDDTFKDSLDQYPHDRRRSRDLPTLTYAEIDISTAIFGTKNTTMIALGDDNQAAFSHREDASGATPITLEVILWKNGAQVGNTLSYPLSSEPDYTYYSTQLNASGQIAGVGSQSGVGRVLVGSAGGAPVFSHGKDPLKTNESSPWCQVFGFNNVGLVWGGQVQENHQGSQSLNFIGSTEFPNLPDPAYPPNPGQNDAGRQLGPSFNPLYVNASGQAVGSKTPMLGSGAFARYAGGSVQDLPAKALIALSDNGTIVGLNPGRPPVPDLPVNALAAFLCPIATGQKTDLASSLPAEFRKQIAFDSNTTAQITSTGDILFHTLTLEGPEDAPAWNSKAILWSRNNISSANPHGTLAQVTNPGGQLNKDRLMVDMMEKYPINPATGEPDTTQPAYTAAVLKVPVEFVTKGKNAEVINTSLVTATTQGPIVELDQLAVAGVTMAGGEGRATVRGVIRDAIADNVPQGQGADIAFADLYVNGEKLEEQLTLTRENDGAPDAWRRHPVKWTFEREVTFPADGTTTISIESGPNAAGLTGSDKVQVHFARSHTGSVNVPAQTHDYEIELSGSFSPTVADTLTLLPTGQNGPGQPIPETGPSTRIFLRSDGLLLAFSGNYQASAGVDRIRCKIVPANGVVGLAYGSSLECVESGPVTNTFRYTETVPAYGYGDTFSHSVSGVTNVDAEPVSDRPLKLRFGIPASWENIFTVQLAGQTLKAEFTDAATGWHYASTHAQQPWIAHLIADPADADSLKLIYWDKTASTLRQIPLANQGEDLKAKLRLNAQPVAEVPLTATRLRWVNEDGDDLAGLHKLTAEALIGFIAGDPDMEIDEEHYAYIEVTGMTTDRRLRVTSSDFPDDKFELFTGNPPASGRSAQLGEIADGHYRTTEKVVVYQSSPNTDTLTNAQWNALKEMGYLAVHNEQPDAKDLLKGIALNQTKPPVLEDHHLFNQFAPPNTPARYKGFFKKVFGEDFVTDQYTIPVEKTRHRQISRQITDRWKALINEITDEGGNLLISQQAARRRALDEMFSIANDFDLDLSKCRVYWKRPQKGLSTVDDLLKLDSFDGKVSLDAGDAKAARWKAITKKGTKRLGKDFLRGLPILGHVFTAWAIVAFVNDPVAAIAAELEISPETARALIDGEVYVTSTLWNVLPEVDEAVLSDGSVVYLGKAIWIADCAMSADGNFRITRVTWYEISSIVPTTEVGTVNIRCIRRGTTNDGVSFDNIRSSRDGCPAEGEVWNP